MSEAIKVVSIKHVLAVLFLIAYTTFVSWRISVKAQFKQRMDMCDSIHAMCGRFDDSAQYYEAKGDLKNAQHFNSMAMGANASSGLILNNFD